MTLHIFEDLEQRSPEWYAARCGIVTASVVGKLVTCEPPSPIHVDCLKCKVGVGESCVSLARTKPTAIKTFHPERIAVTADMPAEPTVADNDTARGLIATLVAERITGRAEDVPLTSDMWRGLDAEPFARDYYSKHHAPVTECGFMVEDRWGFSIGYSPDGLVGDDGLIEIKAPRAKNHLTAVIADTVPAFNMAQLQCGLLVSGRKWIDFIPFVGGLPLWKKRVHPDPAWFAAIEAACRQFETTAAEMVAAYEQATKNMPATERVPEYGEISA